MKIKVTAMNKYTRDCTVGRIYEATRLEEGSLTIGGGLVDAPDGIMFRDDIGDPVAVRISLHDIEIVEE